MAKKGINFLIAPNAYKECLSAFEVSNAIAKGIKQGWKQTKVIQLPVADGGNGTLEVLVSGAKGKIKSFVIYWSLISSHFFS